MRWTKQETGTKESARSPPVSASKRAVEVDSIIDQKKLKRGPVYGIAAAEGCQIDSTKQVINVNMNGAIQSLDSIDSWVRFCELGSLT